MFWNNDDMNSEEPKKPLSKHGRRANRSIESPDDILDSAMETTAPQPPVRTRRAGGWADETVKSAKSKATTNLIEQERFQEQKVDANDDIPIIPDIDEIPEDILSPEVAQAPTVAINKVTTYRELDSDLAKQNSFGQLGDINLSLLTRFMYPEKEIRETDETWTKESLFNDLISETKGNFEKN